MANQMSKLLDKIERRLGTRVLNLPDHIKKEEWAKVITQDTLDTFSRYFPRVMTVAIPPDGVRDSEGYYNLDEVIPENVELLGLKDIDWSLFAQDSMRMQQAQGLGVYDFLANNYGLDDAMMLQMRADHTSLFNAGIYPEFKYPNKIKIVSVTGGDICRGQLSIPIKVFIKHADNLMTISPTKMETFEALAQADVARFLYSELKYFDGLETVYANIDLKLSDLENEANKREDVIQQLKDGYISAANDDQPLMYTV